MGGAVVEGDGDGGLISRGEDGGVPEADGNTRAVPKCGSGSAGTSMRGGGGGGILVFQQQQQQQQQQQCDDEPSRGDSTRDNSQWPCHTLETM